MEYDQIAEMIYMANNGKISKRRVKVLSLDGNTFKAFCFWRGTQKDF